MDLQLYYPHKGWVEQNAKDIWNDTLWACRAVMEEDAAQAKNIAAIGITNQRETVIIWDRETGEPIHNAIVWQDRRTARLCESLREAGHEPLITERTGLIIDPYFSATKLKWLLDAQALVECTNATIGHGVPWMLVADALLSGGVELLRKKRLPAVPQTCPSG